MFNVQLKVYTHLEHMHQVHGIRSSKFICTYPYDIVGPTYKSKFFLKHNLDTYNTYLKTRANLNQTLSAIFNTISDQIHLMNKIHE